MKYAKYKIVKEGANRYRIYKRVLFFFWAYETYETNYGDASGAIEALANPPKPTVYKFSSKGEAI